MENYENKSTINFYDFRGEGSNNNNPPYLLKHFFSNGLGIEG
jgi:hypothetical protein